MQLLKKYNIGRNFFLFYNFVNGTKLYLKIVQINKKIIDSRFSLLFNNACLKNNILQKYTNYFFKIMNIIFLKIIIFPKKILSFIKK